MSSKISVVVPVFNNEASLDETTRRIMAVHKARFADADLEIVFVDDGSKDQSWNELLRLKYLHDDTIHVIKLARNFGQAAALFAGFNNTKGDAVICVSADLQDPIDLIGDMVKSWREGNDIVIAYREARDDGAFTSVLSNMAYRIHRLSHPEIPKGGFDFWLMSHRVCNLLCSIKGRHNSMQTDLLSLGFNRSFIPYTRVPRAVGKSGYTFLTKMKIVLDFIMNASYLPIRSISLLGFLTAIGGVIYSFMIVHAWFANRTPFEGWAPLMIIVLLIGGMIMIMLGIIGEYVWRIYDNLKGVPYFVIDEMPASKQEEKPRRVAGQS